MVLEKLSWGVACPNYTSFRLLTVAGRGSCGRIRKWILLTHPVVGFVLQVRDAEKLSQAPGLKSLYPILRVSKQGPRLIAIEEDGGDKQFIQLELAFEADGVPSPDLV